MFLKKKSNILFRNYVSFGYITDNRLFGYSKTNDNENHIGAKILSESGNIFFSVLDRKPQRLHELAKKIRKQLCDVDINTIKSDAKEFYHELEIDGFVVSGNTYEECDKKDPKFSYNSWAVEKRKQNFSLINSYPEKSAHDFLEEYFNGKPQLMSLHIEITGKCNERCIHCYIPHENKVTSIAPDLFYDVLRQCKEMRLLHLTLSGGEPMLHKNFCDFLKRCREYDFSVNILTNLTFLNNEIIKEMKENPLLGLQVSLYSMDPNIHDEITQMKGSFNKTMSNILKLIENDIPSQISCPLMKQNKTSYKEVIKWAEKYKIKVGDDYVIIGKYNHDIKNLNCRLSINEVREIICDKVSNNSEYLKQIGIQAEKNKNFTPDDFICSVCSSSICIAENGNVYPCAGWQDYVVGNVKEKSLIEIWNDSSEVHYLRSLRRLDFPKCIQCTDKEFCTMCMVRNANESPSGNPLDVNEYFCNIAKFIKRLVLESERPNSINLQGCSAVNLS